MDVVLAELKPHPRNYNRHSEAQIGRLVESLRRFGQPKEIVTHRGYVIAGHGIVEAARRLKWRTLRASDMSEVWSEEQALAFMAADNELARLADPDEMALAALVTELQGFDAELAALAAGTEERLAELVASLKEPVGEDPGPQVDKAAELQVKWGTATGQLWELGEHRLICGDCTDAAVVERVMGGEKAVFICADPPYNRGALDVRSIDEWIAWCAKWIDFAWRSIDANGSLLVFGYPYEASRLLCSIEKTYPFQRWLSWFYSNGRLMPDGFKIGTEVLLWFSKAIKPRNWMALRRPYSKENEAKRQAGKLSFRRNGRETFPTTDDAAPSDWFDTPMLTGFKAVQQGREHVAQKPLDLIENIVEGWTLDGEIMLDPFLGSGTTLIACEKLGRRCRAVEIEPKYVAVALERWAVMTGQTPVRMEQGDECGTEAEADGEEVRF